MTLHRKSAASVKTVLRKRSQAYQKQQYIYFDNTCEVTKQINSVSGAAASNDELCAHVLRETSIESESYDNVNTQESERGKADGMRDDYLLHVSPAFIF